MSEHPGGVLLAWVAPLLWLLFFQHTPALVAYVVGVLGLTLVASTQHEINALTGVAFHVINAFFAATYLLPSLPSRVLMGRVPSAGRWLLLPLTAVGVEYGLALGPNGTSASARAGGECSSKRRRRPACGCWASRFRMCARGPGLSRWCGINNARWGGTAP